MSAVYSVHYSLYKCTDQHGPNWPQLSVPAQHCYRADHAVGCAADQAQIQNTVIQSERDTVIKGMGMNIPNREEVRGWDVEQVQEYLKQVRQTESFVNSSAKFNCPKVQF